MPKKHSELQKRDAMDLLEIHGDITIVHQLTGIPRRTLRRWRAKSRRKQKRYMAEKHIASAIKRPQTDNHIVSSEQTPPHRTAINAAPTNADAAHGESDEANENFQTLLHIRDQLLRFSSQLVDDLDPNDPDINLRTLSLSRALDRIYWLDETLYPSDEEEDGSDKALPPNRIAFVYEEQAGEYPPWHNASQEDGD